MTQLLNLKSLSLALYGIIVYICPIFKMVVRIFEGIVTWTFSGNMSQKKMMGISSRKFEDLQNIHEKLKI